ncbi:MAG TPA: tetratricopeptide repeat protein [Blastocatellia bacterium]|nr:tetratricopeptide repeat protein [Blastocatellia bacterium]
MTTADLFEKASELYNLGQYDDAIAAYREVIRLDDLYPRAWYGLGCSWEKKREDAIALSCFQKALSLAPEHGETHHNLGKVLHRLGLADDAMERFTGALALGKGFLPRTAIATLIPGSPRANNGTILQARRSWAETHLPPADPDRRFERSPVQGRRLRVGYLSSFFQSHNWMKPVWGLINHHNRDRFDVYLFSDGPEAGCEPCYQKHAADRFHDITGLSNRAAAELIESCELDLLVDLNGYSKIDRLAVVALKPAPIVIGWFNLYATSGMACYDYLIGDDQVIPSDEEAFYVEKILRVPGCYLTFEVLYRVPDVVDPPMLSSGKMTFGCLASQYKITDPVVDAWSRILISTGGTRLFLKNATLDSAANRDFLARRFESRGVSRERITMEGSAEHFDFLASYGNIDVALDTFPYNGGTTTSEALWQGVPVITFGGDRWAARQSASICRAAALGEYVSKDVDDYIRLATALAAHPDTPVRLKELRRSMRGRLVSAPVRDTVNFAKNMEGLYEGVVR